MATMKLVGANPSDWLGFIEPGYFANEWKRLGLDDEDFRDLQMELISDPRHGRLVPGTGGLRKLRFAKHGSNRGKSGSYRVGYAYFEQFGMIGLLAIYSKTDRDNISPAQKREIKKRIQMLHDWLAECG